jgi:phage terminase small subunit
LSKLTAKQEAFCIAYIETGNASEAYRLSYDAENCKPESVHRLAKAQLDNVKIASRIEEIQKPAVKRAEISLESHLNRLKHLSDMAEAAEQYSSAIKAEESRGKASGLYTEKKEITGKDGEAFIPDTVKIEFVNASQNKPEA